MQRLRRCSLLFAAALAAAAPALPQNLVANSEFDDADGLDGWFNGTGSWQLGADSGTCAGSNAALGTSATAGGGDQFLSLYGQDCLTVDPVATPSLYLGVTYRTTASVWARLYLQFFSDAACGSHIGYSATVFGSTSASFNRIVDAVDIPANAGSMRFWVDFNPQAAGIPQYTAEIDRIYLGDAAEVFVDGYEAEGGSACRWSPSQGVAP